MASKLTIATSNRDGRTGNVAFERGIVLLPEVLFATSRGAVPFVGSELMPTQTSVQVALSDVYDLPGADVVAKHGKGLRGYLSLNVPLFLTQKSHFRPLPLTPSNEKGVALDLVSGRQIVTPQSFMKALDAFRPDFATALSDEVGVEASKKRSQKAIQNSLRWLDECISLNNGRTPLIGVVLGATETERIACAKELSKRQDSLTGYYIGGLGLGESPEQRETLIAASLVCSA